ncbi:hypothetical protein HYS95_03945 [Candidatus Daviesbacteria bacterium]|nr:hypothetical protein [Candidatus Daviesbacteria bacterium]
MSREQDQVSPLPMGDGLTKSALSAKEVNSKYHLQHLGVGLDTIVAKINDSITAEIVSTSPPIVSETYMLNDPTTFDAVDSEIRDFVRRDNERSSLTTKKAIARAHLITKQFRQVVSQFYEQYALAQEGRAANEAVNHFLGEGAVVLHMVFDTSIRLGGFFEWNYYIETIRRARKRDPEEYPVDIDPEIAEKKLDGLREKLGEAEKQFPQKIADGLKQNSYQGVVQLDFTKEGKASEVFPVAPEVKKKVDAEFQESILRFEKHTPSDFYLMASDYFSSFSRKLVVIVDGYGRNARENGFLVAQYFPHAGYRGLGLVVMRASNQEWNADSGYGSIWAPCHPQKPGKLNLNPKWKDFRFESVRSETFLKALDSAIQRGKTGERVCIRAPFGYGKTTALMALNDSLIDSGREDTKIATVEENGAISNLTTKFIARGKINRENLETSLGNAKTLILDEAGRLEAQPETKAFITDLENSGVQVLRIYPGDIEPPKDLLVMQLQ